MPQGTILSPIFCEIYTSSLQYVLEPLGVSFHLYADDTQVYFRISDSEDDRAELNRIAVDIESWMLIKNYTQYDENWYYADWFKLESLKPELWTWNFIS